MKKFTKYPKSKSSKVNASTNNYNIQYYQIFKGPNSPSENGKMVAQAKTKQEAVKKAIKLIGPDGWFLKAVCDDGQVRYADVDRSRDKVTSANYGGAYDIRPEQYFTKDDLMEFGQAVVDEINEAYEGKLSFDLAGAFVDGNTVEIDVVDNEEGYEWTGKVKVDMRKFNNAPKGPGLVLIDKYKLLMIGQLMKEFGGTYDEIISSTIMSGYWDPPEDDSWEEVDEYQETVKLDLDAVIIVGEDRSWEYEDETYPWAKSDSKSGYWYGDGDEYAVSLGDEVDMVEHTDELLEEQLPETPGAYHVTGDVSLVFDVFGVETRITDGWFDERHGFEYDEEIYTDNAEVDFNKKQSGIKNLKIEPFEGYTGR